MKKRKLILDKETVTTSLTAPGDEQGGFVKEILHIVTDLISEPITQLSPPCDTVTLASCEASCEYSCMGTCADSLCICPSVWDMTCGC
jgi:hypothetical protein